MSDSSKRLADAFRAVAKQLAALSDEELGELIEGSATVRIESRTSPPKVKAARASAAAQVDLGAVVGRLNEAETRDAAEQLIREQGLTVPKLKDLAKAADVAVPAKAGKDALIAKIVDGTVGFRLRSRAIRGY